MARVDVQVLRNEFPTIAAEMDAIINRAIRKQVLVSEGDVKENIVRYDAIDTGNMLGSKRGEMTGQKTGLVSVSAESEQGYPYPAAVNYGTRRMAARPFWTEAEVKAEQEFPARMRRELEAAIG